MKPIITSYILLKLASRCNINCTYCYWFRDDSVLNKPKVLTKDAEEAFIDKLKLHIKKHQLKSYFVLFHGGEPLLFGKQRFSNLCKRLRLIESELNFTLRLSVTTNGILIDKEWIGIFRQYKVNITISIDGPKHIHDKNRIDIKGNGTFDRVKAVIDLLNFSPYPFGVLSVCDPSSSPKEVVEFMLNELNCNYFDILIPDANNNDKPESISKYYIELFEIWYYELSKRKIKVRIIENIIRGIVGIGSTSESIGLGVNTTYTLLTDGSIEPLDILRIAGNSFTKTNLNIFENNLDDIYKSELFYEVFKSNENLHEDCKICEFKFACGGGHIAHRWSNKNRFNNPSVYCKDLKEILNYVSEKIKPDLKIETI